MISYDYMRIKKDLVACVCVCPMCEGISGGQKESLETIALLQSLCLLASIILWRSCGLVLAPLTPEARS